MFRMLFCILVGVMLVPIGVVAWFYRGNVPVAVADPPLPFEREITGVALNSRIDKELILMPPVQPEEKTFIAGAHVYLEKCAVCHGVHGRPSAMGDNLYPAAPQLWEKHRNSSIVGVSDDPPGETYWKVANGIRLTGMPEFRTMLSDTEMWQVSVLLANADKPLPPAALNLLRGEPDASTSQVGTPASTPQ
jgi:thiosulfate dehydrogenase